jgi:hypothetical protein
MEMAAGDTTACFTPFSGDWWSTPTRINGHKSLWFDAGADVALVVGFFAGAKMVV